MRHRQRERGGHRGVDRVAAVAQTPRTPTWLAHDVLRRHHAVAARATGWVPATAGRVDASGERDEHDQRARLRIERRIGRMIPFRLRR